MSITGLTLVLLNKRKSDDAGNLDGPARSHKVLPLSEKMKQLHKEKNHMLRLLSGIFCLKLGRRKKIVLVLLLRFRPQALRLRFMISA